MGDFDAGVRAQDAASIDRPIADAPSAGDTAPGTEALALYTKFLEDRNRHYRQRLADCFGVPVELFERQQQVDVRIDLALSLARKIVLFDEATGRACLDALTGSSCDQIADLFAHGATAPEIAPAGCARVLAGTVPLGGVCHNSESCRDGDQTWCRQPPGGCGRCSMRAEATEGAACDGESTRCSPETWCRFPPAMANETRCIRPQPEGAPCRDSFTCGLGLHCAWNGPTSTGAGTCRPHRSGTPCAGSWECLPTYACVGVAAGRNGTCQRGKAAGEPCTLRPRGPSFLPDSECAMDLRCMDIDGGGLRCRAGAALGEPCGQLDPAQDAARLECLKGYCDVAPGAVPGVARCTPHKAAGEACASEIQCARPTTCPVAPGAPRVCTSRVLPLGAACRLPQDARNCGHEAFCAVGEVPDGGSPFSSYPGTCVALLGQGQRCYRFDRCAPGLACTNGACTGC